MYKLRKILSAISIKFSALADSMTGWQSCDFAVYQQAYVRFGGSICTHPDVITFLSQGKNELLQFKCRYKKGELSAALYLWNNSFSLLDKNYPLIFDDIFLPVSAEDRFFLLQKSRRLSPEIQSSVANSLFSERLKRKICYIKKDFSKSTTKKRNGELRSFLKKGGAVKNISEFSNSELADIYIDLFKARWGETQVCYTRAALLQTFEALRHLMYGHVLLLDDTACAFDIIFYSRCQHWIYFDDINGGFLTENTEFSLGTLLLWVNIQQAKALCLQEEKEMIFSLGILGDWHYKKQWCDIHPLGRSVSF